MGTKDIISSESANGRGEQPRSHRERVLGMVVIVMIAVLPVLFSEGFNQWTSIPTNSPFAAATGYRIVSLPSDGDPILEIDSVALHNERAMNVARHDHSNPLPFAEPTPGLIKVDLSMATMMTDTNLPDCDGTCCYSEFTFSPNGVDIWFTGTDGAGRATFFEVAPNGTVSLTQIDPAPNNLSGDAEATTTGLLTLTSSTNTDETLVFANTFSAPQDWNPLLSRSSDDVFQGRHPGVAVDPEANDLFLVYPQGPSLNLLKYDVDGGQVIWEIFNIVTLGSPPDATFNYFQAVEDDGHLAVLAPQDTQTSIWFAEDAGGVSPPTATQVHVIPGPPPGDHQGFTLDGRLATLVRPDPDGTGTVIHQLLFNPDPSVPPNLKAFEDNTVTGSFYNMLPNYTVQLLNPADPSSAVVYDMNPNENYLAVGNVLTDTIEYGTVPQFIHFDGFESGGVFFWNP
jgi:hypothetical protein